MSAELVVVLVQFAENVHMMGYNIISIDIIRFEYFEPI